MRYRFAKISLLAATICSTAHAVAPQMSKAEVEAIRTVIEADDRAGSKSLRYRTDAAAQREFDHEYDKLAPLAREKNLSPAQRAQAAHERVIARRALSAIDALPVQVNSGIPTPPAKEPRKLGPIDSWRFERCKEQAIQAPTEAGVRIGLSQCRSKFDQ